MKIALWGYYGHNYGDDIMLYVIIDNLNKLKIDFEVIDMFNGNLNKIYGNTTIKIYNWKNSNKIQKILKLKNLANKNIINVWGGGTIFTETEGDGNYKLFKIIKMLGGKFGYIGVGIGELKSKGRIKKTKNLLENSDIAIFRDESSFKQANRFVKKNKNFFLADDLSYLYFNNLCNVKKTSVQDKYLLITWRNLKNYLPPADEDKLMKKIVKYSIRIKNDYNIKKIVLATIDSVVDKESCQKLLNIFKNMGQDVYIDQNSSIENITNLIANSSFHFSGRLHGSVASEYFNIPTLSLSYSPKMMYFYKSINKNNVIDIFKEELTFEKIKEVLSTKEPNNFDKKINDAKLNLIFLKNYLEKGFINE